MSQGLAAAARSDWMALPTQEVVATLLCHLCDHPHSLACPVVLRLFMPRLLLLHIIFGQGVCGDSYPTFPIPDTFNTVNNPLHKSTTRAGALVTSTILPGWRASRVGPGQYPQYTRAPKMGGGCG